MAISRTSSSKHLKEVNEIYVNRICASRPYCLNTGDARAATTLSTANVLFTQHYPFAKTRDLSTASHDLSSKDVPAVGTRALLICVAGLYWEVTHTLTKSPTVVALGNVFQKSIASESSGHLPSTSTILGRNFHGNITFCVKASRCEGK